MSSFVFLRRIARDRIIVVVMIFVAIGVGGFAYQKMAATSYSLRISAGRPEGLRFAMAESLASESRAYRVEMKLVATAGSEDSLDKIDTGKVDLALVQGGLDSSRWRNVRQVAALHIEPLHLLVKQELAEAVTANLDALKHRSVNLGEVGSGTRSLATAVLRFAGLQPGVDFRPDSLSYEQLETEPSRDRLPDAVFMVSLLPSKIARKLATTHSYRLVPILFAEAFALDSSGWSEERTSGTHARDFVRHDRVVDAEIPPFVYGVRPAVPSSGLRTIGTRLLLVARKDLDPEPVARVMSATFGSSFAQLSHPALSLSLLSLPPEFPAHPGKAIFEDRSKPLITENVIDAIEKEISIAGALLGAAFFLWQWLKSRYRRLRESGFEHYILRVAAIEDKALRLELSETLDLPGLLGLQDELGKMKAEAISKFAEGELEGEDLLSGFLAQASDARDHLTRLILHRRDDLERQARKQKRDATVLWREALEAPAHPSSSSHLPISMPSE